jgi:hypothetical protein
MNQVTICFTGICTHFSQSTLLRVSQSTSPTSLPKQRVVLINATEGAVVHELPIVPHSPMLTYGDEQIALTGCTIRLRTDNSASIDLELTDTFKLLPNLTNLVAGLVALGDPAAEVVLDQDATRSACYFDIDFGRLSACYANGAATTLEVESASPITLEITPWGSSSPATSLPLLPGALVTVSNVDSPSVPIRNNDLVDFLLHYKTVSRMPHVPQVPHAFPLPRCAWYDPNEATVGAGCSNSNYP